MKEIIEAVDIGLLETELTSDKLLRKSNYGDNELYIITHHDSPNVMREVGRLREITFRQAGGGTGKDCDMDSYDTMDNPYKQLIVWDPETKSILGGYRFFNCAEAETDENGQLKIATGRLFKFSEKFVNEYLPYIIELGRSFVIPTHQSSKGAGKRLYTLDNLWDGLGAIWANVPTSKYFFGKVTMYPSYNRDARNLLLYFINKYFGDHEELITPLNPVEIDVDKDAMEKLLTGGNFQEDYKIVSQHIRTYGEVIPPLINSYINLSPSLRSFGTVLNDHFGEVEETATMVELEDMYETKTERHVKSFNKEDQGYDKF
jgi:hypothetical protein